MRGYNVFRLEDFHGRLVREAHSHRSEGRSLHHTRRLYPVVNFLVLGFLFGERILRKIVPAVLPVIELIWGGLHSFNNYWQSQGESNPCLRRERAIS